MRVPAVRVGRAIGCRARDDRRIGVDLELQGEEARACAAAGEVVGARVEGDVEWGGGAARAGSRNMHDHGRAIPAVVADDAADAVREAVRAGRRNHEHRERNRKGKGKLHCDLRARRVSAVPEAAANAAARSAAAASARNLAVSHLRGDRAEPAMHVDAKRDDVDDASRRCVLLLHARLRRNRPTDRRQWRRCRLRQERLHHLHGPARRRPSRCDPRRCSRHRVGRQGGGAGSGRWRVGRRRGREGRSGTRRTRTVANGAMLCMDDFTGCWPLIRDRPPSDLSCPGLLRLRLQMAWNKRREGRRRGPPCPSLPSLPDQLDWPTPCPVDARFRASPREAAPLACVSAPETPGLYTDVGELSFCPWSCSAAENAGASWAVPAHWPAA